MKIPSNNTWTQTNSGDLLGVLAESENVTLDDKGKIQLSKKAFNRINSTDYGDLSTPLSIVFYDGQYIAMSSGGAWKFDFGGNTTSQITVAGSAYSDMVVCYDRAYITTDNNLSYYNGFVTNTLKSLTTSVPHPMTVFDSLPTFKLCIGNGNTVLPLDSSHNTSTTTLILPLQYQVTTMAYRNGYLYVGTKHKNGGEAKIFIWDGQSTNANYEVPTGVSQIYSVIPYLDSVAFITNTGRIAQINGNSAITLATLPIYAMPNRVWDNTDYSSAPPKVLHRGMVAVNDQIYINIDGTVDSGEINSMKHGLWVFDQTNGLYHRAHSSQDRSVVETPTALNDGTLTVSTHNLKDGDLVLFREQGSLTGIKTGTRYYIKVVSSTEIKLAKTQKALVEGHYIAISGAITGSNISYVPNTSYTTRSNTFAGAITAINPEEPFWLGWESPVIWGNRMETLDGGEFYALMSFTESWNIGRFTTQRIYSDNLTQSWSNIGGFFDGVNLDNEKIIIKYKTEDSFGYPTGVYKGVWLNTNTINSVDTDYEWTDIEEGDEVTIVDGYGRGYTAHVTTVTPNTTFSITVDEEIGTANKLVYFYVDKFNKLTTITNLTKGKNGLFSTTIPNVNTTWIQIKVEMRGFQTSITSLDLTNNKHSGK